MITPTYLQYNGWTNIETWLTNVWLTNDEVLYTLITSALCFNNSNKLRAQWLEQQVTDVLLEDLSGKGYWLDLLRISLHHVSWIEIIAKNEDS
jgi:hypothetical protein